MLNGVVIAALTIGAASAVQADGNADVDAVMKALDAEIEKTKGKDGGNGGVWKKPVASNDNSVEIVPSDKRSANAGRRAVESSLNGDEWDEVDNTPKDLKVVSVTVLGKGETPEEARLAAFRAAVEKAVGIYVDAESIMKNSELLKDRVNTISNADIKEYETIKKGKLKSGLYAIQIKAKVEKKAIAPKFRDVFPAAFADIGEEASTIHVQKVTRTKRSGDAASLMTATLEDVNRMRNWTRLSVPKGKGLEEVTKIKYRSLDLDVAEVPGKGLYKVRYSIKIDEDAYFKGFLPHFKQVLTKMQEGEAEEGVALTSGPIPRERSRDVSEADDGHKILTSCHYAVRREGPADLQPFCGYKPIPDLTYFIDPIELSEFPGVERPGRGQVMRRDEFMFDRYKGVANIKENRTYNIWLIEKMNQDRTAVRCSAYKVPASALRAYWKNLYGEVDSEYVLGNARSLQTLKLGKFYEQIEIVLLDGNGDEISARVDTVPNMLLAGEISMSGTTEIWAKTNVFDSFFVRPLFVHHFVPHGTCYSTEIQRDVYFPLTDSQLGRIKSVKVRFVRGGKSSKK